MFHEPKKDSQSFLYPGLSNWLQVLPSIISLPFTSQHVSWLYREFSSSGIQPCNLVVCFHAIIDNNCDNLELFWSGSEWLIWSYFQPRLCSQYSTTFRSITSSSTGLSRLSYKGFWSIQLSFEKLMDLRLLASNLRPFQRSSEAQSIPLPNMRASLSIFPMCFVLLMHPIFWPDHFTP